MKMRFAKRQLSLLILSTLCLGGHAMADRCTAEADFERAYPSNSNATRYKFKFRTSSDDCTEYGCSGYVHYRIHFLYSSGNPNSKTTLVSYRIPAGQRSRDITDETFPSGAGMSVQVQDVEITEVTCSTP